VKACAVLLLWIALTAATRGAEVLPTVYESGHFYAAPRTRNGERLKLLIDTGGGGSQGMYWLSQSTAERIGLHGADAGGRCGLEGSGMLLAPLPRYRPEARVPKPSVSGAISLKSSDFPVLRSRWMESPSSCCLTQARPRNPRRQALTSSMRKLRTESVSPVT
jgi:hypothetical protein